MKIIITLFRNINFARSFRVKPQAESRNVSFDFSTLPRQARDRSKRTVWGAITFCFLAIIPALNADSIELKEHEKFWEHKGREKKHLDEFASWWGNENAISRILTRLHIIQKDYKSILDVGCGFCTDYDAFKKSCPDLHYYAIDVAPLFIQKAIDRGILAQVARVQELPFEDNFVDVVYARHLLEHLDNYQNAIKEMARVAKQEVIIVFFIKPQSAATDKLGFIDVYGCPIYQNRYSKAKFEAFLKSIDKVKSFTWQEVKNKDECILHIYV